ncbi:MAG TPA: hypothetical protein VNO54_06515, partial [Streptosporangiaceae bacterium]|nr:hypothetical protein [Streptosporangiaceae bacterium]
MSTLAEAKADLGHQEYLIREHRADCLPCRHLVSGRTRQCDDIKALLAVAKRMRADIRTWFAPQPGDATLFDE